MKQKKSSAGGNKLDNRQVWDNHYNDSVSRQSYPDENVVRYIRHWQRKQDISKIKCLDLGSGSGRNLKFLRENIPGTIACDFSQNALLGFDRAICCSAHSLPFVSQYFDFILCWGVLHYLGSDERIHAINEIFRVLKPGGRFFATIRDTSDTHLQSQFAENGDLAGGFAILASGKEVETEFSDFTKLQTGFLLRRPLGEKSVIAHTMVAAEKPL